MVLSLLVSFGTAVGAHEGIKASMAKSRKEEHRSRKNNLIVHCPKSSQYSPYLEGRRVVLSGDRLYIDTGTAHDVPFGHPFEGYYIPYPDSRYAGLVTTITPEAPIMNWVFMDPLTYSFQFGVRAVADANLTGPWDCTRQDRRLTFCGWEGFCAVLEDSGVWGLYYDFDGDGMRKKFGQEGRVVIEIELIRSELRTPKPEPEPEPQPDQGANTTGEQKDDLTHQKEKNESVQQKGERPTEPENFSTERVEAPSKAVQEIGVTLDMKMERMFVGKVEDEETYSVISEPLSTMSTLSTTSGGMPRKRRKRRSRAKKYQSPSVENSEEEKGTVEA